MKKYLLSCTSALLLGGLGYAQVPKNLMLVNFDKVQAGQKPEGLLFEITGKGLSVKWQVIKDETAPSKPNVLAQLGRAKGGGNFPLAIFQGATLLNGNLRVKFKAVAGQEDQAGGLIWRYKDRNNYYIVRANALEDNVVLYKVQEGRRKDIPPRGMGASYGAKIKVPSGRWNNLRVNVQGNFFTVYFNGEKLFEVEDDTFQEPGKVGLWTKADSVTYFDDFEIKFYSEKAAP